ncbi:hypothetical protein N499_0670A, partial [Wolbachia pipientis wVitA]
MANPQLG